MWGETASKYWPPDPWIYLHPLALVNAYICTHQLGETEVLHAKSTERTSSFHQMEHHLTIQSPVILRPMRLISSHCLSTPNSDKDPLQPDMTDPCVPWLGSGQISETVGSRLQAVIGKVHHGEAKRYARLHSQYHFDWSHFWEASIQSSKGKELLQQNHLNE